MFESKDIERSTPTRASEESNDEPPDEIKGRGLPVVGNKPTTHDIFKNAWNTIITVRPAASKEPNGVLAWLAIRKPPRMNTKKATITRSAPTRPNSSPMIAKMKSVSASGKYCNFS